MKIVHFILSVVRYEWKKKSKIIHYVDITFIRVNIKSYYFSFHGYLIDVGI